MDERLGERRKKKEGRETDASDVSDDVRAMCRTRDTYTERSPNAPVRRTTRGIADVISAFFFPAPCNTTRIRRRHARVGARNVKTRALFPAIFRCWTKKIPAPRRFFVPPCFRRIAQSRCAHHIHGRGRSALGGVGVRGGRVVNDGEDLRGGAHTERANSEVSLATRSRREKAPRGCDQGKQPDARSASHASSASRASRIRLRVEYRRVSRSAP